MDKINQMRNKFALQMAKNEKVHEEELNEKFNKKLKKLNESLEENKFDDEFMKEHPELIDECDDKILENQVVAKEIKIKIEKKENKYSEIDLKTFVGDNFVENYNQLKNGTKEYPNVEELKREIELEIKVKAGIVC